MLSNKVKFLIALAVAVVVLTPLVVSLAGAKPVEVSGPREKRVVAPVTEAPAFVDDPQVIGSWKTVDFVREIQSFEPGKQKWTGDLDFLRGIEFMAGGRTSGPWQWSQGTLWHPGDQTLAKYTIKEMGGTKFLFMEWMSGDVTIRGEKPWYYVFTPGDIPAASTQNERRSDQTSASMAQRVVPPVTQAPKPANDPNVVGAWRSVDFVKTMEDFVPGKQSWTGDLYLKGLEFMTDGRTSGPWQWGQEGLWHPGDQSMAKYTVKNIGGSDYLFMEWMSGDVLIRGQKPCYYVMVREGTSPA